MVGSDIIFGAVVHLIGQITRSKTLEISVGADITPDRLVTHHYKILRLGVEDEIVFIRIQNTATTTIGMIHGAQAKNMQQRKIPSNTHGIKYTPHPSEPLV